MLHVIHTDDRGAPDGYASYRTKEDWKGATSHNEIRVMELMAASPSCHASLWRYLLDTDLAKTISCARGRVDESLRWLLADPRRFSVTEMYDFLWLRLLDVAGALAARRYAAADRVVIEIDSGFPSACTKRYLLNTVSEKEHGSAFPFAAECTPSEAAPDLALDEGTLAATYLGGVSFATLAAAGRVRELTPGAVTRADTMFLGSTSPFCSTEF